MRGYTVELMHTSSLDTKLNFEQIESDRLNSPRQAGYGSCCCNEGALKSDITANKDKTFIFFFS